MTKKCFKNSIFAEQTENISQGLYLNRSEIGHYRRLPLLPLIGNNYLTLCLNYKSSSK